VNNTGKYKRIKRFGISSCISAGEQKTIARSKDHLIHIFKGKSGNLFYFFLHWFKKFRLLVVSFIPVDNGKQIKIIHLISSLSRGGKERQLLTIYKNNVNREHEIKILYINERYPNYLDEFTVQSRICLK